MSENIENLTVTFTAKISTPIIDRSTLDSEYNGNLLGYLRLMHNEVDEGWFLGLIDLHSIEIQSVEEGEAIDHDH